MYLIDVVQLKKKRIYVPISMYIGYYMYTANIFDVIFTGFNCVRLSTVMSLYGLHSIALYSPMQKLQ